MDSSLEISLFGPGYGESIVAKLADDFWLIVDSCKAKCSKIAEPLRYLRDEKGVDVGQDVRMVVVSHWHDDHTRGISQVVEACSNARVVLPNTLRGKNAKEFLTVVSALSLDGQMESSGVSELYNVLIALEGRTSTLKTPIYASQNRDLPLPDGFSEIGIRSLSPGDYAQLCSTFELGNYIRNTSPKRRLPSISPNEASIALQIQVNDFHILLGGDQESGDELKGWQCIVLDSATPKNRACVVKVPHHAAESGYHSEMWGSLAIKDPVAIATPYIRGGRHLPNDEDRDRILQHTDQAYLTVSTRATKTPSKNYNAPVQKTLKEAGVILYSIDQNCVHIRIMFDPNDPLSLNVETLKGALHFTDV